ncbi:MAG: tetratricopeptide repeat protein [Bacteroidetes bacterium]|nr:MAG: tetratricopeptide repeat protein [Bacteroidota bacterium]
MNTQPLKLIFKGRLEFGSQRTFEMVLRHWQNRLETYYKTDILFKAEEVLVEDDFSLTIPQQKIMNSEKAWRSTTALLEELAQFAVAGNIWAWCIEDGRLLSTLNIEPDSDKVAVQEYLRGRNLVGQKGKELEATEALSRAIDKYERHALAYERRGYVNYKLTNYNDALHDFSKSIRFNPNNPEPYYGCGKIKMLKNDWEGAVADFDQAVKRSLALQPLHWLARLKKGESLFHAKKYQEAAYELRLYLKREFQESDPNHPRRRRASYLLGKALLALNDAPAALEAFDLTLANPSGLELVPDAEGLLQRAIAKRQIGDITEYTHDLQEAAKMGSTEAARLLEEWEVA